MSTRSFNARHGFESEYISKWQTKKQNVVCKALNDHQQQLSSKQPVYTKLLICYTALKRICRFSLLLLFHFLSELHFVCKREEFCLEPCIAMHTKQRLNSAPGGCLLFMYGGFTALLWGHIAIDLEHKCAIFCSSL